MTSLLINTADAAVPVIVGVNGTERGRFTNLGFVITSSVSNSSGLYFNQINSSTPKSASNAYLAVDGAGKLVVGASVGAALQVLDQDFSKTNTTLANVTGSSTNLSFNVDAGATYKFRAVLHITADVTGGLKFAINGTATATSIVNFNHVIGVSAGTVISLQSTTLNDPMSTNGVTTYYAVVEGAIKVNAAGTLVVQFAQKTASGTSTVLRGSSFELIAQ